MRREEYVVHCAHRACGRARALLGEAIGGPHEDRPVVNLRHTPFPPWRWIVPEGTPVVEIGFGKGRFLVEASRRHPDFPFLGIENTFKMVRITLEKLEKHEIGNVRLIWGNASEIVGACIPDAAIAAYHVYFPDPWPKRKHHKRRLLTPSFIAHLFRTLKPGGEWHFATDVAPYYAQTLEITRETTPFEEIPPPSDPIPTAFELKYRAQGRPIYRTAFRRPEGRTISAEMVEMSHPLPSPSSPER